MGAEAGVEVVELTLPDDTPLLVRATRIGKAAGQGPSDGGYGGPSDTRFGVPSDTGFGVPSDTGMKDLFSFDTVTKTVHGMACELHKALSAVSPDRVSVEFAFDLAVKGNQLVALIASGGVHAAIKIKLEWGSESTGNSRDDSNDGQPASA
jgi:hypothetical protein